jgi:hypothetical protein
MRGTIPPLPQYIFMAWCLVKHSDNFTFTFIMKFKLKRTRQKPAVAYFEQILRNVSAETDTKTKIDFTACLLANTLNR